MLHAHLSPRKQVWLSSLWTLQLQQQLIRAVKRGMNGRYNFSAGVAMDDLVYICTKIARQMDAQGLDHIFDAAEAAAAVAEEAKPLLQRVVELVDEVQHSSPPLPTCRSFAGMHAWADRSQANKAAMAAARDRATLWTRW